MLELKDITKIYRTGTSECRALDGVNIRIRPGEFISIMGPSGSGKSTLLHFLGFLDRPTSGDAVLDGVAMSSLSNDGIAELRNSRIGYVFQSFNLAPTLSVFKNVELPMIISGDKKQQRQKRVEEMLSAVKLLPKRNNLPSQLSGGEKQRVAIARALTKAPDVILADEPTGNLDSASGKDVMDILYHLWKDEGKTIVVVTHEPVVAAYAKRTIHLRDGKIEKDVKQAGRKATEHELKIKK